MTAERIIIEVNTARKDIKTDHYNMSVGEIVNLYLEDDLSLSPAYQRLFRWDDEQKTNFIESLILGFPIPPLFVAQEESGHWDIVDGVQRISTILQLTGDLRNKPPLKLTSCKYIPSLENNTWITLPKEIQRLVKRAKLTLNIIITDNSVTAQYEVFQRLNTGGLHLSDQEIRNCLIIMSDDEFYKNIEKFKTYPNLMTVTPITEDKFKEEYRMELIIRYLIAKSNNVSYEDYKLHVTHVREFIDAETLNLIKSEAFDLDAELALLQSSIDILADLLGQKAFVKYSEDKVDFDGKFSLQVYEALLPGFVSNADKFTDITAVELEKFIIQLCTHAKFKTATKRGQKALVRFKLLTELSYEFFGEM